MASEPSLADSWALMTQKLPDFELELVFSSELVKSVEEQGPNCDDIFSPCPLFILYTKGRELQ